ncbi:uncharacterized protein G2W53_001918 [Senna tora]|uniref:Uncharacterized protein n=1 Tax=Senna tora TaxID=362788 RepID=A0A834TCI2_9FABA|nr:uncharacterized protein G2W53_028543 [Senna tora]KAF7845013.1 uncharacterized protein G2W53_001918 [Senna tora]
MADVPSFCSLLSATFDDEG